MKSVFDELELVMEIDTSSKSSNGYNQMRPKKYDVNDAKETPISKNIIDNTYGIRFR